jgi:hypothetical protein
MGMAFFRVAPEHYARLRPLVEKHESEPVGPRARGFWLDRPDDYDYEQVQADARQLYDEARNRAAAELELSENEAHSLSLLEMELPGDGLEYPPSLFLSSAAPEMIKRFIRVAQRKLGPSPELAAMRIAVESNDPRYAAYLQKQVRHLRDALPKVWNFYAAAEQAGQAVIVIDLRARDLEIPDAVEMAY